MANISLPCQEFALDSIGLIFLGSRLGALQGSQDSRQLIESMGHLMAWSGPMLILPLKVGQARPVPVPRPSDGSQASQRPSATWSTSHRYLTGLP